MPPSKDFMLDTEPQRAANVEVLIGSWTRYDKHGCFWIAVVVWIAIPGRVESVWDEDFTAIRIGTGQWNTQTFLDKLNPTTEVRERNC